MKKEKKIIIISITAIIISALVSIVVLNKLTLKKPVFLMNYCELCIYEREGKYCTEGVNLIDLEYISNVQDTRNVNKVTFKEMPNTEFYIHNDESFLNYYKNKNNVSGRYKMNSL